MKTLTLLLLATPALAQKPEADHFATSKGDLVVQPITHATMVLTWNNINIYVDPYGGAKAFEGMKAPDYILITDIHQDHLNMETLNGIDTSKAIVIAPQAVADKLPENLKKTCIVLKNGGITTQKEIGISAIAMYNLPEVADAMHTKGRGNGYVLNFGGKTVYISGDTEDIPEMRNLKNIDVAFVCMNLPYTMDINQAASAVLEFKPKVVYPFHYRGKDGMSDTEAFKKLVNVGDAKIDVRLRDWYSLK